MRDAFLLSPVLAIALQLKPLTTGVHLVPQENEKLVFLMDDAYNVAKYTFLLRPDPSGGTRVSFAVDCHVRLSPDATSASVKLAR